MKVRTTLTLILILLIASSNLMILATKPAAAQSIPTPSIPTFTVRLVDPPETQQNNNKTIEVTINNQPFTYTNNSYHLYYNLRVKQHSENESGWIEKYQVLNGTTPNQDDNDVYNDAFYVIPDSTIQSTGEHTTITLYLAKVAGGYNLGTYDQRQNFNILLSGVPSDGQIDFQVEAIVGHESQMLVKVSNDPSNPSSSEAYEYVPTVAYDSSNGWSDLQTIKLANGLVTITNFTPNPSILSSPTETLPSTPLPSTPTSMPANPSNADNKADPISLPITTLVIATSVALAIAVILGVLLLRRHPKPSKL